MAKRGPRTEAGKRRSAMNALSHGVLARTPVIPGLEDEAEWTKHREGFLHSLAPATDFEAYLVERIAQTAWRLKRLETYENELLTIAQSDAEERAVVRILHPVGDALSLRGVSASAFVQARIDRLRSLADLLLALQAGTRAHASFTRDEIELLYEGLALAMSSNAPSAFRSQVVREITTETPEEQSKARDIAAGVREILRDLDDALGDYPLGRDEEKERREPPPPPPSLIHRYPIDLVLIRTLPEVHRLEQELLDLDATIARIRRESLLLGDDELARVTRYEAHLRRQFTQYLHELEARQSQRGGDPAPLARLDVQLLDQPTA